MSWEHLAEGMREMYRPVETPRDTWEKLVIPPMLAAAREADPDVTQQEMIDLLNSAADYPDEFRWDLATAWFGVGGMFFFADVAAKARKLGG